MGSGERAAVYRGRCREVVDLARRMQQPGDSGLMVESSPRASPPLRAAARCQLSTIWMTSAVDSLRGRGAPPTASSWLSTSPHQPPLKAETR